MLSRPAMRLRTVVNVGAAFAFFLAYSSLCLMAQGDDLAIISAGVNLLTEGRYGEYHFAYTHRGLLTSILNGAAFLLVGDVTWARNIVAAAAAVSIGRSLWMLAAHLPGASPRTTVALVMAFPFFPFALGQSAVHLLQTALWLAGLRAVISLAQEPTVLRAGITGTWLGLGCLTHPFSVLLPWPLFGALFFVLVLRRRGARSNGLRILVITLGIFGVVVLLQPLAVYSTSGEFKWTAEPPGAMVTWNATHPPVTAIDTQPSSMAAVFMDGQPPQSLGDVLAAWTRHPEVYIRYFLAPTAKAFYRSMLLPELFLIWLPLLFIGTVGRPPDRAILIALAVWSLTLVCFFGLATIIWTPRQFFLLLVTTAPLAARGVTILSEWCALVALSVSPALHWIRRCPFIVAFCLAGSSVFSVRSVRAVDQSRPALIPMVGSFLQRDLAAPPSMSRILTTTSKPYLWRQDYDWQNLPIGSGLSRMELLSRCDGASTCYLLLENDHNDGCALLGVLLGNLASCTPELVQQAIQRRPGETLAMVHSFVSGVHAAWIFAVRESLVGVDAP